MSDFSSMVPGVNGTGSVGPVSRVSPIGVNRLVPAAEPKDAAVLPADTDRVELSDRARFLDMLRQFPDIRQDRIDRIKQAIETGTYDSDDKIDAAIEQLVREELV